MKKKEEKEKERKEKENNDKRNDAKKERWGATPQVNLLHL